MTKFGGREGASEPKAVISMADDSKLRAARSGSFRAGSENAGRSQSSAGDPLAELAKLIGQDDLFEQMRRDAARQAQGTRAVSPSAAPQSNARVDSGLYSDGSAPLAGDLRGSYEPQPASRSAASLRQPSGLERREQDYSHEALEPSAPSGRQLHRESSPLAARGSAESAYDDRAHDPHVQQDYHQNYQQDYGYESYVPAGHHDSTAHAYGQQHVYDQQHAYDQQYAQEQSAHEQHADQQHAYQQHYDDPAYDPAYAYDDQAYADQPANGPSRRGGLMTFGAVAGLALLGTAGAFGYWALSGERAIGEPPVITANTSPTKVAPAPQARSAPPSGFDRNRTTGQGERVVPREEQPVELQQSRGPASRTTPGGAAGLPGQSVAAMVPPTTTGALASPDQPKRVKTIAIRPDGSVVQDSERTSSAPPPRRETPAPSQQMAALPPATQTPTPAPPPAAGTHVVQVSSQRSQEDAQASFKALQAKYPTVLGGRDALIRRIDLGTRGVFYRVQVGPFASSEQANDLCGNLKAAGGQCIVQRN